MVNYINRGGPVIFLQKPLIGVMWIDGRLLYTWDDGTLFSNLDGEGMIIAGEIVNDLTKGHLQRSPNL